MKARPECFLLQQEGGPWLLGSASYRLDTGGTLEHLSYRVSLGELRLFSLEDTVTKEFPVFEREGAAKSEPGSSQGCPPMDRDEKIGNCTST